MPSLDSAEPLFGPDAIAEVLENAARELRDDPEDLMSFEEWIEWFGDKLKYELEQ